MARSLDTDGSVAAIAWDGFQARTQALAALLGGTAWHIRPRRRLTPLLPVRYLLDGVRTWRLLAREQPHAVLAVSPPVFAPLTACAWTAIHGRTLVVDCHTNAFHGFKWRWSRPLHRLLFAGTRSVLVHTEADEDLVRSWGIEGFLLPDDVPDTSLAARRPTPSRPTVVIAGSLDANEPVAIVLEAAAQLPDVEFRLTGDTGRLTSGVAQRASHNVVFTGWLRYEDFLGELAAAHVVGVFSTDPRIMNRAAFEAVGLGRPLVLSDLPGLRKRFGEAALMCRNEASAIAATIAAALQAQDRLSEQSARLGPRLRAQHERAVARLRAELAGKAAMEGA